MTEATTHEQNAHITREMFLVRTPQWSLIVKVVGRDDIGVRLDEEGHPNNHAWLTHKTARELAEWLAKTAAADPKLNSTQG